MKILLLFILLIPGLVQAQIKISGKVTDEKGQTLGFANISLLDTYDGGTVNEDGTYSFVTEEKGVETVDSTVASAD